MRLSVNRSYFVMFRSSCGFMEFVFGYRSDCDLNSNGIFRLWLGCMFMEIILLSSDHVVVQWIFFFQVSLQIEFSGLGLVAFWPNLFYHVRIGLQTFLYWVWVVFKWSFQVGVRSFCN